MTVVWYA